MHKVTSELETLLEWDKFLECHSKCGSEFIVDVRDFLRSTMDEVRTSLSRRVAESLLEQLGIRYFGVFREAVLVRELTGYIAYPNQRDHSAHTVYNYLLGWYFYRYCKEFKRSLNLEFKKRGVGATGSVFPLASKSQYFGFVWLYVSLLHDIGYMFEGGLKRFDLSESIEQANLGARKARGYFQRLIWQGYKFESVVSRKKFLSCLGGDLQPPEFRRADRLSEIADDLRSIGTLDVLSSAVRTDLVKQGVQKDCLPDLSGLAGDAFELWKYHFSCFESPKMRRRMESVRRVFDALIDEGLPNANVCLLDHAVCSGLLVLLASTYHYRLCTRADQESGNPLVKGFLKEVGWDCRFWWTGIVWATAATAVHNIQQLPEARKLDRNWPGKLGISEDPLSYIGVLIDLIEEWDRYSVFKGLHREPIQGADVELGHKAGRVVVRFLGRNGSVHVANLRKELTAGLQDWANVLEVQRA